MDTKRKALLALIVLSLSGCSLLNQPDVERSFSECISSRGSAAYTVTSSMRSAECRR